MARDYTEAALDLAKTRMASGIADVAKRLGGGPRWTPEAERQMFERLQTEPEALAMLQQAAQHKGDGKAKCPMCQMMKRQVALEERRLKRVRGKPDIQALAGGT